MLNIISMRAQPVFRAREMIDVLTELAKTFTQVINGPDSILKNNIFLSVYKFSRKFEKLHVLLGPFHGSCVETAFLIINYQKQKRKFPKCQLWRKKAILGALAHVHPVRKKGKSA